MRDYFLKAIEKERKNPTLPNLQIIYDSAMKGVGDPEDLKKIERYAIEDWNKGNIEGVFCYMPNTYYLNFVYYNIIRLHAIGKYEEALLIAYTGTRTNWAHWPINDIKYLFDLADPDKLCAAGDPIPDQDIFKLYRGVSGKGPKRRVNGYSWTDSLDSAIWFAKRFERFGCENPAVFEIIVSREHILAAMNERNEHEYLLKLPLPKKPKRLSINLGEYEIQAQGETKLKAKKAEVLNENQMAHIR